MIQKANAGKRRPCRLELMKMAKPATGVESQTLHDQRTMSLWILLRLKIERVNKIPRGNVLFSSA